MSIDLDFFGKIETDNIDIKEQLQDVGKLSVIKESRNINVFVIDGVKVDFINYPYQWIDEAVVDETVLLASPRDIAAMKVNAIEGRGSKKDFIDLYFLLQHYSIQDILGFYAKKYPEYSIFRALMSLTYFEDAESQFMPQMFTNVSWEEIKNTLRKAVAEVSK